MKNVVFDNRKKQMAVTYSSGKEITFHYGSVGIDSPIREAWIDRETRGQSIGMLFMNGKTDYMPYDQPPALVKDPDFLLQDHIETLIARIKETLHKQKISKRYLAEQLGTSDNQVQRLLNPEILNKNLSQLYHIGALLGLEVHLSLKQAA